MHSYPIGNRSQVLFFYCDFLPGTIHLKNKEMKRILALTAIFFFFQSCSKEEFDSTNYDSADKGVLANAPIEIKNTYFENWVSGVRGGGAGTHFYIELKEPISDGIFLGELYFRGQKTKVIALSELLYLANFPNNANPADDVSSGSATVKSTLLENPPFPIDDDQALLEYFVNRELNYYLIKKVSEQESEFTPQ